MTSFVTHTLLIPANQLLPENEMRALQQLMSDEGCSHSSEQENSEFSLFFRMDLPVIPTISINPISSEVQSSFDVFMFMAKAFFFRSFL